MPRGARARHRERGPRTGRQDPVGAAGTRIHRWTGHAPVRHHLVASACVRAERAALPGAVVVAPSGAREVRGLPTIKEALAALDATLLVRLEGPVDDIRRLIAAPPR